MLIQFPDRQQLREQPSIAKIGIVYDTILQDIKTKHLSGLGEPFIAYHVEHFLRTNPKKLKRLLEPKYEQSSEYQALIKYVRQKAHPTIGLFGNKQLSANPQLAEHLSTKERLQYYNDLKELVPEYVKSFKTVLDIGAGLNPLAWKLWMDKPQRYDTIEVYQDLCALHDKEFPESSHYTTHLPIYYRDLLPQLPKYDVVLAWKAFDAFEEQKRHSTIKMLQLLKARWLIASFSMKNIKGDDMRRTEAGWFEKVVRQSGFKLANKALIGTELYYFVLCNTTS